MTKCDPLLLTCECLDLAKWFKEFPHFSPGGNIFNTENTFSFEKVAYLNEDKEYNLRVQVHNSLIPNSNNSEDTILNFYIFDKECKNLSEYLFQSLDRFPINYKYMSIDFINKIQKK